MLNKTLRDIYLRIYVSRFLSCLQSLDELYSNGDKNEYLRKMEVLYSDLLRFPHIYNRSGQQFQSTGELIASFSELPGNPVSNIYSSHINLLLKIEQLIGDGKANELNDLSDQVRQFLNTLYDSAFPRKRTSKRLRYSVSVAAVIALVFLTAFLYSPLKKKYVSEREEYRLEANQELYKQQTISDVLSLIDAIKKYYSDNKSYPKSSGGWDAVVAAEGGASKEIWIAGLAPKYIKELPVDPRKSKDPGMQYMYRSDGTDFKLIAHNPLGIEELVHKYPGLIDPARPSWAVGAWTEGAKNW